LTEARQARKAIAQKVVSLGKQVKALDGEYRKKVAKKGTLGTEIERLTQRVSEAEISVTRLSSRIVEEMRNPHALAKEFATSLTLLKNNLDSLKLPDSTSRQFFAELLEEDDCICGRPLNAATRKAITERSESYLGEDEFGVLNSIKASIGELGADGSDSSSKSLEEALDQLSQATKVRGELQTERRALEEEQLSQGDVDLAEGKEKLDAARASLSAAEDQQQEHDRDANEDDDEDTNCIKSLEQQVKDAAEEYAEATETIILKRKTELVRELLEAAQSSARTKIRKMLVKESNERIKALLQRSPVVIDDIQDSLLLKNQRAASAGQTLSIGYAFLATLFSRKEHNLPFVVDSPAGALDLAVRGDVARLLPMLSRQCIAFTISSERAGFVDALDAAAGSGVQYLTLFRRAAASNELRKRMKEYRPIDTGNGYLVAGRDFFDSFDVEDEEV
jgi:DNA sulfur modification protein DndD